jgi:hypothetical protein
MCVVGFPVMQSCGYPVNVLDVQYRMHPAISMFPSQEFYQGRLKDGEVSRSRHTQRQVPSAAVALQKALGPATSLTTPSLEHRLPISAPPTSTPQMPIKCRHYLVLLRPHVPLRLTVHVPVPSVIVQGVVTQTSRPWHDKKCFGPFALFDLHGKEDVPEGSASIVNRCGPR